MRVALTIALWELRLTMRRVSFWIVTVLVVLLVYLPSYQSVRTAQYGYYFKLSNLLQGVSEIFSRSKEKPIGYLDKANFIKYFPDATSDVEFRMFPDEYQANEALKKGEISSFYTIDEQYPEEGYVGDQYLYSSHPFAEMLRLNLLKGDSFTSNAVSVLLSDSTSVVDPPGKTSGLLGPWLYYFKISISFFWAFYLSLVICLLLYWVENVFARERDGLTLEVLLTSASPRQILLGKFIGLYLANLLRLILYSILFVAYFKGGNTLEIERWILSLLYSFFAEEIKLIVIYLLLSILCAIGFKLARTAVSTRLEHRGVNYLFWVSLLSLSVCTAMFCANNPNSLSAWSLSIFPLTSPVAMVVRSFFVNIPSEEIVLSIILLSLVSLAALKGIDRFFQLR